MDLAPSHTRRLIIVAVAGAVTIIATGVYQLGLGQGGWPWLTWSLVCVFALLTGGLALSLCTSIAGITSIAYRGRGSRSDALSASENSAAVVADTAIILPIYNEDSAAVCAAVLAMIEDLERSGHGAHFHTYILSDSTDPDRWLREERRWQALIRQPLADGRVFYRHRSDNSERKTGNISDFLTRWGLHYQYAVVLDADSVMTGASLATLRQRMIARPETALIQTDPRPVGRLSLWARQQQYASALYGPIGARGLRLWAGDEGTFFGHNAIIRIAPFLAHCGLGHLPGHAPLGGAVLSHDFVEAALLIRAGWKVEFHDDLGGSWEECPTTLLDFAKRDRRWCQGNLQHVWVLFQPGLHWVSRMHLFLGIIAYVGSPLWVLFVVLSLVHAASAATAPGFGSGPAPVQLGLFLATMAVLMLPKTLGVIIGLCHGPTRQAHGGALRLCCSALLETLLSALVAPIMMLYHARFVIETLTGISVQWTAQTRGDQRVDWRQLINEHLQHVCAGAGLLLVAWWLAPWLVWWLAPVWLPLLIAVPVAAALGSVPLGTWLRDHGLLLIAEERRTPDVLQRAEALAAGPLFALDELTPAQHLARFVADPQLNELHAHIQATTQETPFHADRDLIARIESEGCEGLTREQRFTVLRDPDAMRRLHRSAWSMWPRDRLESALGHALPMGSEGQPTIAPFAESARG